MKGAAAGTPGQVIIADYPEPAASGAELVVETLACGICATDVKLVNKGAEDPRYALGHEMVGRVLQAPPGGHWKVGQRVALAPYLPCGHCFYCRRGQFTQCSTLFDVTYSPGGLAERVLVPAAMAERGMLAVPPGLNDSLAALAEPLGCVIKGLQDSHLQDGDVLLVIGDGPMGLLAAGAARARRASQVIVAGMTTHRLAIARDCFADLVVDLCQDDLRQAVDRVTGQRGADVVLVAVSSSEALADGLRMVRPGGEVNMFAGVPAGSQIPLDVRGLHYQQYHLSGSFGTAPVYMQQALDLMAAGTIDFSPILSAHFPFERVGEAVAYVRDRLGLKAMVTFTGGG